MRNYELILLLLLYACKGGSSIPNKATLDHDFMQDDSDNVPGIMVQLRRRGFEEASHAFTDVINAKIRQVTVSIPDIKYSETYLGATWEVTVSNMKIDHFDTPDAVSLTPSEPNFVDVYCPNLIIRGSADIFIRQPGFLPDINGKVFMSTKQATLLMSFVMNNNAYIAQPISSDIIKCDAQLGDWDIAFDLSGISGWIVDKILSAFTYIFYGTISEYLQPQVCDHAPNFVKTYVNDNSERIPPSISAKDVLESMGITGNREPSNTIRSYVRHILQSEKLKELLLFYGVMQSTSDGNTFTVELDGSFRQDFDSERPHFNHWKISPSDSDATNEMMLGLFISDNTFNTLFAEMQRISFLDIVLRPDSPTSIGEFLRANCKQQSCLKDLVPVLQRNGAFHGTDVYLRIRAKRAPSMVFGQDGRVFVDLLATADFMVDPNNWQGFGRLEIATNVDFNVAISEGNKLTLFANIAKLKLTEIGNGLRFTEADLDIDNEKLEGLEEEINDVLGTLTIPTDIAEDFVTLRKTDVRIVEHALQINVDFKFKPMSQE